MLATPLARELAPSRAVSQLTLEAKVKAKAIAFLHAGLWPVAQGTAIARMTVQYSDGTQSTLEFIQGDNTSAWQADANAPKARRGWTQPSSGAARDVSFTLRVTRWKNPYPDRTIAHLRFEALSPETGWALAGLTLLD